MRLRPRATDAAKSQPAYAEFLPILEPARVTADGAYPDVVAARQFWQRNAARAAQPWMKIDKPGSLVSSIPLVIISVLVRTGYWRQPLSEETSECLAGKGRVASKVSSAITSAPSAGRNFPVPSRGLSGASVPFCRAGTELGIEFFEDRSLARGQLSERKALSTSVPWWRYHPTIEIPFMFVL